MIEIANHIPDVVRMILAHREALEIGAPLLGMSAAAPSGSALPTLPFTGRIPAAMSDLSMYNPNQPDAIEAVWQPYYDFQSYATAGSTQQLFFQVPAGQSSKTLADTNMTLAGQFPAPTAFLLTAIMVVFMPHNAAGPSSTAAAAAANTNINDATLVANSGWLSLNIGSKTYLTDAPIGKFPPNFSMGGLQAYTGTFTAGTYITTDFARAIGRYYEITPLLIPMNQNFAVTLNWPTAVAVTNTGRIGVIMDGFYYRLSQ
jgi:hypothetical protein